MAATLILQRGQRASGLKHQQPGDDRTYNPGRPRRSPAIVNMPRTDQAGGPAALLVSHLGDIERVIDVVCARQRFSPAEIGDFASHVKLKLVENDYSILRGFRGGSSIRTYLTVVIHRLLLDYRNSLWGKWRPSAEARREGPTAVLLERLLMRDGYSFEEACEVIATNHRIQIARLELEHLAAKLPVHMPRRFERSDTLDDVASADQSPGATIAAREDQQLADQLVESLRHLISGLDTIDRLILAMRFGDSRAVPEIAVTLRIHPKILYRRIERLLRDLRKGLIARGVDQGTVVELLANSGPAIDWRNCFLETSIVRSAVDQGALE